LFTVLLSSFVVLIAYYIFVVLQLLPEVITTLKFRVKKLFKKNSLNLNLVFLPNLVSYNKVLQQKK